MENKAKRTIEVDLSISSPISKKITHEKGETIFIVKWDNPDFGLVVLHENGRLKRRHNDPTSCSDPIDQFTLNLPRTFDPGQVIHLELASTDKERVTDPIKLVIQIF